MIISKKYYFNHGLVSFIARRLIWIITNDSKKSVCFYLNNKWVDWNKNTINWIDEQCNFSVMASYLR